MFKGIENLTKEEKLKFADGIIEAFKILNDAQTESQTIRENEQSKEFCDCDRKNRKTTPLELSSGCWDCGKMIKQND